MWGDVYILSLVHETGKPPPSVNQEVIDSFNNMVKIALANKIAPLIVDKIHLQVEVTEDKVIFTGRIWIVPPEDLDSIVSSHELNLSPLE